ncbi:MAG TPA: beta-L-arabinofuranosidase domain-containing protein, partial [Tepidisphaeraceae bacterium]|nr:beta-L-arabinofuranosidase domain-containing protein [Tepidisphaeraceae bacterium]
MTWIWLLISAAMIGAMTVSLAAGAEVRLLPAVVPLAARPFDLADVRLLDGPFRLAQDLDEQWLLSIDTDRLLSGYRSEAGLEPKAPRYGGWESRSIGGHSLGHYLSALSLMYAATGKQPLLDRVTYIVNELADCQRAHGDGYLSGIPNAKPVFAEVARGQIR